MKVLTISAAFDESGGATRIATDLVAELKKRSITTPVFAGTYSHPQDGVLKIKKSRFRSLLSRLAASDFEHFATDYLLESPDFTSADIVHMHNAHGWYFNLETLRKMSERKPVVWTLHDMWALTSHCSHTPLPLQANGFYTCEPTDTYPKLWWNNRAHLEQAKARIYKKSKFVIVTPSEWLMEKVAPSILGENPRYTIHNGIDTTAYSPIPKAEARSALGLPSEVKIALFVANGGIDNLFKGGGYVKTLAASYQNNPNVRFVCIGGTVDREESNVLHKKSIKDKAALAVWYSAADVLLFTSKAENFPLVVLEAMACGLPVASFKVGGVGEAVLHRSHGYIADPEDCRDLRRGVEYVLHLNADKYALMQNRCRERVVEHFSLSAMTEKYLSLYSSLA